ncbi:hypothetical protein P7C73_g2773, partial [Tremellales sp. Uapishka_1]
MSMKTLPPSAHLEPVVILGAGPSGLLLARYLQLYGVPVVIYERDPSPDFRPQGGSLDLHDDTGLKALRATGLMEIAQTHMRPEGEAFTFMDKTGKIWYGDGPGTAPKPGDAISGRPEIDRTDLRNLLISSLLPDSIRWDHAVAETKVLTNSLYEVSFKTQPSITTSILVGADGAFSRVRPLLHSLKPTYAGMIMYDMTISASSMTPALQSFIGPGAMMAISDEKGVLPQMNSGGKCKVYVGLKCPEQFVDENPLPETGKREWILNKFFDDWSEEIKDVVRACDEEYIAPRRIWTTDVDTKWTTDLTGCTIMGDAAHVMSPFAGEGVNQALADALDLGETLVRLHTPPHITTSKPFPLTFVPISHAPPAHWKPTTPAPASVHRALRKYERRMYRRVAPIMKESLANQAVAFSPGNSARAFKYHFMFYLFPNAIKDMVVEATWGRLRHLWEY